MKHPKLRDGIIIRKVAEGDDVAYTVCDTPRNKYFRLDPVTRLVAVNLDGRQSVEEISRICQAEMPYTDLSPAVVREAVQDLDAIGLLEDPFRRNVLLIERARSRRPRVTDFFKNMLLWQVGVWDPDRFLDRTIDRVRWIFRPSIAAVAAIGLLWSIALLFARRHDVDWNLEHLVWFGDLGVVGFALIWTIIFVTGAIHELGHAYACKHFGGEVHRIGFMLMYFSPCFFVDVSHSMLSEDRRQRIWVAMGGIFVESFFTIAAALLWLATPAGDLINEVALRVLLLGLIVGVVLNLNPLLKFDGYYVLSDLLQISELREKSFRFWRDRVAALLRRGAPADEVVGLRRRRAYVVYGLLAAFYSGVTIVFFLAWLRGWLVSKWAEAGFLLFVVFVGFFLRKPVLALAAAPWLKRLPSPRAVAVAGPAILVAVFLGAVIRTPGHVVAEARLLGGEQLAVCAREPGRVDAILVREGQRVHRGQVVALLSNSRTDTAWREDLARVEAGAVTVAQALERRDPLAFEYSIRSQDAARARADAESERKSVLALTAPLAGQVVTHRTLDRIGAYLEEGDTLLVVESLRARRVECDVDEAAVGEIRVGQPVEVRLRAAPGRVLRGRVDAVHPRQSAGKESPAQFVVTASLDPAIDPMDLGMTGRARIETGRFSLWERLRRVWARFVQADFWL